MRSSYARGSLRKNEHGYAFVLLTGLFRRRPTDPYFSAAVPGAGFPGVVGYHGIVRPEAAGLELQVGLNGGDYLGDLAGPSPRED